MYNYISCCSSKASSTRSAAVISVKLIHLWQSKDFKVTNPIITLLSHFLFGLSRLRSALLRLSRLLERDREWRLQQWSSISFKATNIYIYIYMFMYMYMYMCVAKQAAVWSVTTKDHKRLELSAVSIKIKNIPFCIIKYTQTYMLKQQMRTGVYCTHTHLCICKCTILIQNSKLQCL